MSLKSVNKKLELSFSVAAHETFSLLPCLDFASIILKADSAPP